ncbi:HEAT repeat domain-containing protein [Coleofasciculus sp. FACHB-64]|uniref:HEAT repeat domain-containing protein n=1 Tax=Cyanophyceae TaxID=3028117 RepID=UPI001681D564|nr:HEAT repeat domain-containing protein [Coleofasciculus sp. FACHB-64]MBD2044090.1 HEAT repeat domain-containing protein [Coleofasciculus sp. FACHB-64]
MSISSPTEVEQQVHSWLLNYSDLSQAQNRHSAFRDLTRILQQYENAAQEVEQTVLLNRKSNINLLAVTVGALSSQGTLQAQQALCATLQVFHNNTEKVMLLLPQVMLLEEPQDFLFDELQTFIRKSHNPILRENAELALAGLSRHAYQANQALAEKINTWLEDKKSTLSKNSQSLSAFLDLLGNTGSKLFLEDILQATNHKDPTVRAHAAFALRLFKGDQIVKTLEQLAVDQNSEVKTKAMEALSYSHLGYGSFDEAVNPA